MKSTARVVRVALALALCGAVLVAADPSGLADGPPSGMDRGWAASPRGRAFFSALLDLGSPRSTERASGGGAVGRLYGLVGQAAASLGESLAGLAEERPAPPDVRVLGSAAIVLSYDSVFDVHDPPDPAADDVRSQAAGFDTRVILSDLARYVDASLYDFCLLYTVEEVPGWVHAGPRYSNPAANIGLANDSYGASRTPPGWPRLRSAPHMNSLDLLTMRLPGVRGLTGTVIAFHEIGHYWGVRLPRNPGTGVDEWSDDQPVAWLGAASSHWTRNWQGENEPGIMSGTPTGRRFNAFDLYAMGLMGYDEAATYSYVVRVPERDGLPPGTQRLTLDDLIQGLALSGGEFHRGDGRRDPDTDESARDLRALLVVVKGRGDDMTTEQEENLMRLAEEMPAAWSEATWGRSTLSVEVVGAAADR
jgi:hypothetical protein